MYYRKILTKSPTGLRGVKISLILAVLLLTVTVVPAQTVLALNKSDIEKGITQFDMDADETCDISQADVIGSDVDLPTITVNKLKAAQVAEKVEANKARYVHAQEQTGVPWQLIAALHYREAGLNPNGSVTNGAPLGSGVNADGVNIPADPNEDAVVGANIFKSNAKNVYGVDIVASGADTSTYGKAYVAYNRGFMYKNWNKPWNKSPYAMNGYDDRHMNMKWTDADSYATPGGAQLNSLSGSVDGAVGALAVVKYLGGVTLTNVDECESSGSIADTGNIVETAKSLAWHKTIPDGRTSKSDATPAYQRAMPRYNGSTGTYEWTDCGVFVSTVMHMSGADKQFPLRGTSVMLPYVRDSGKYEVDESPTLEELEPGDILVKDGHISLYAGNLGNGFLGMEASLGGHVPDYSTSGDVAWMLGQPGVVSATLKGSSN